MRALPISKPHPEQEFNIECLNEEATVTENKKMISMCVYDVWNVGIKRVSMRSEGRRRENCGGDRTGSGTRWEVTQRAISEAEAFLRWV